MISRKRDEAVTYCLIQSAAWDINALRNNIAHSDTLAEPDLFGDYAFRMVYNSMPRMGGPLTSFTAGVYLEAASLLADGWSPGDPVVRL